MPYNIIKKAIFFLVQTIVGVVLILVCNIYTHAQNSYDLDKVLIQESSQNSSIDNAIRIDTKKLQSYNDRDIGYALSHYTPIFLRQYGFASISTISIRSSIPSQNQVIWNNLKLNSPLYGFADLSLIPVFFISNINLYQGPSSLAYGTGSLGGAVIIDSYKILKESWSVKYMQQIGSFYTFGEFLDLSYKKKSIQSSLKIFNKSSKNNFFYKNKSILDSNNKHPVVQNKNANYSTSGLMYNLFYAINKLSAISNDLWINYADRKIPDNALIETQNDKNFAKQNNLQIMNVINYKLYKNARTLLSYLAIQKQGVNFYSQKYVYGAPIIVDINSYANINTLKLGLQLNSLQLTKNLLLNNSLSYSHDSALNIDSVKTKIIKTKTDELENITTLKTNYKRLSVDLTLDNVYKKQHHLLYYVGINYLLNPKYYLVIKLAIGSQLRFPSINDLYFNPGGNPDLLPEKNNAIELSSSIKLKTLSLRYSLYYARTNNWVLWLPKNSIYWQAQNIGQVASRGLEVFLNYNKHIKSVILDLGGSFNYSSVLQNYFNSKEKDKQLPYMPKFASNFYVNLTYNNSYIKWVFTNYSKRYTSLDKTSLRDTLAPYFMNDIVLGHNLNINKLSILLEIKILNLFDENYYASAYMPMPGRNFTISITANL